MFLQFYTPHPALQDFVSRLMIARYVFDKKRSPIATPFPPQPEQCIYFYPYDKILSHNYSSGKDIELPSSMIVGPQLSRVDLTMNHDTLVIYVGFHPGGLHRLIHLPMHQLTNQPIDASLLLGTDIHLVTEQLNEAKSYDAMIKIVERFLLNRLNKLKRTSTLEMALQTWTKESHSKVDQLSKEAYLSVRQLERQFKERVGMTPKLFAKLVRFSRAWRMRENDTSISWTTIAYSCGYADQMHLIRDFKEFTGSTPSILQNDLERSHLRLQAELTSDHAY